MPERIHILDFGSQYTQLIARRLREIGVFCVVRPCTDAPELDEDVRGLVLSGGPASVLGDEAPPFDEGWLDTEVPVLGICYGMQLLAKLRGGEIRRSERREYGRAELVVTQPDVLLQDFAERSIV